MPPESEDPSFMLVDSATLMQEVCIHNLEKNKPTELAFDLDCWIRLATNDGREYVIDVLLAEGVWDCVGELSKIFSDCSVVKIGHGIGEFDVQSLHQDFGIFVANAFDTHKAAKTLRLKDKGLAKRICCHYGMPFGSEYQSWRMSIRIVTGPEGRWRYEWSTMLDRTTFDSFLRFGSWWSGSSFIRSINSFSLVTRGLSYEGYNEGFQRGRRYRRPWWSCTSRPRCVFLSNRMQSKHWSNAWSGDRKSPRSCILGCKESSQATDINAAKWYLLAKKDVASCRVGIGNPTGRILCFCQWPRKPKQTAMSGHKPSSIYMNAWPTGEIWLRTQKQSACQDCLSSMRFLSPDCTLSTRDHNFIVTTPLAHSTSIDKEKWRPHEQTTVSGAAISQHWWPWGWNDVSFLWRIPWVYGIEEGIKFESPHIRLGHRNDAADWYCYLMRWPKQ